MLPFVTTQAVALRQGKQRPNKTPVLGQNIAAPSARKGFWSRVFQAMIDARMRQADIELRYHRGLHEDRLQT